MHFVVNKQILFRSSHFLFLVNIFLYASHLTFKINNDVNFCPNTKMVKIAVVRKISCPCILIVYSLWFNFCPVVDGNIFKCNGVSSMFAIVFSSKLYLLLNLSHKIRIFEFFLNSFLEGFEISKSLLKVRKWIFSNWHHHF